VANLPFNVDDDQLQTLFSEYKVTKAHVIIMANRRSKGFGFVVLDGEDEQQRALAGMDKYSLDGRELIVKVAFTEERDKDRAKSTYQQDDPESRPLPDSDNRSSSEPTEKGDEK